MISLWKPLAAVALAGGMAVAVAVSASAAPTPVTPAPRMTAVELANGVIFNQGAAASYLTALDHPAGALNSQALQAEHYVDHALQTDPSLANVVASELQSGNRIQVQAAMAALGKLALTATDQVYGTAATDQAIAQAKAAASNAAAKTQGLTPDATTTAYVAIAAVAVLVVVVIQVLSLIDFFGPNSGASSSQLSAEQAVNLVALHLKAA